MKFILALGFCFVSASVQRYKASKTHGIKLGIVELIFFYDIFKNYPEIQASFYRFYGVHDFEILKEKEEFVLHASKIVSFMSEVIDLVQHPKANLAIDKLLTEITQKHENRGISRELVKKFYCWTRSLY